MALLAKRLTKTIRFLATQVHGSADQVKANEFGIPVVGLDKAERILEEAVVAAELAEREAGAGVTDQRAAYWNHTWKTTEKL